MLPGFETVTEINDEMNHSTLLVEQRDSGLLIVTLNRPDEGNAVNTQMGIELLDFWTGLVRDRDGSTTRSVVLTGAGEAAFCAGGDVQALHTTCMLEMRAPTRLNKEINTLLAEVNSRLWVGHFELSKEEHSLMFRHTLLLRGIGGVSHEQIEDLVDVAVGECDRFYPAFQFVIWGGRDPQDALAASLLETQGEA